MGKRQNGRTMVEMLGVLAIVAVLAVGVYSLYAMASRRFKINQTIDLVQSMVYDLRTANMVRGHYYGNGANETQASSSATLHKYLVEKGVISRSLCSGQKNTANECATLAHPIGGSLILAAPSSPTVTSGQIMTITLQNLNRVSCVYIATSDWSTGGGSSDVIQSIQINGGTAITTYPADQSTVTTQCIAGGNNNTIVFTLRPLKLSKSGASTK